MNEFTKIAEEKLKREGFRLTKTRKAVLKALIKTKKPLNAYQIADKVRNAGNKIDTVTVYRILDVFQKLEIIHETRDGYLPCQDYSCSKKDHCHHQFICNSCNAAKEIHLTDKNFLNQIQEKFKNIKISSHYFEFQGTCDQCLKKANA